MRISPSIVALGCSLLLAGCNYGGETPPGQIEGADTSLVGHSSFRDAVTTADGAPQQAASPTKQPAEIVLVVHGVGDMAGVDENTADCQADLATGEFYGVYDGQARLTEFGTFRADLHSAAATFETRSGCPIPELEVGEMAEVLVRAELEASNDNCADYCAATGRAQAETECGPDAACRADVEGRFIPECTDVCITEYRVIVAEHRVPADVLAAINDGVSGTALGQIEVDLAFATLETDHHVPLP